MKSDRDHARFGSALTTTNRARRKQLGLGLLSGLVALTLFNEFTLTYLFSLDLYLEPWKKFWIRIADAGLVLGSLGFPWIGPTLNRGIAAAFRRAPGLMACGLGVFSVVSLIAFAELGFHAANIVRVRNHPEPVRTQTPSIGDFPTVGHARAVLPDRILYDVTYTMDANGRRVTPASPVESTGRDVVFFGCSFTFGEGVEDGETLPNQVARRAPGWRVTNFGWPGHGPGQVLARVENPETAAPFHENEVKAIYVFITNHVERAIGTMRITTTWAKDFPYYVLTPDGTFDYRGTMTADRPRLSRLYGWLTKEPIMNYFSVDLPAPITERHLELTTRLIGASRDHWLADLDKAGFTVVIFPARPRDRFPVTRIIPHLKANGIPYLDYSDRFKGVDNVRIRGDGHPSAKAYGLVAEWLTEDLKLNDTE